MFVYNIVHLENKNQENSYCIYQKLLSHKHCIPQNKEYIILELRPIDSLQWQRN